MSNSRSRSGRHQRSSSKEEERSCCTWPRIILAVCLLAVIAVLIWKFAPIDEAINTVLPNFNSTTDSSSSGGDGGGDGTNDDNGGGDGGGVTQPTEAPFPTTYRFMQCQDPNSLNCCNGLDGICDLQVDQALFATAHNAMATKEDGFLLLNNHNFPLEQALVAGYRGLNLDVCNCGGTLNFCHGLCSIGTRSIEEVMTNVNQFLDENPSEVVIFLFQINSDVDQTVSMLEFSNQIQQVSGGSFKDKIYEHPTPNATWPTLGQLRNPTDNRRAIMFYYNAPSCAELGTCPPGFHYYPDFATETQFEYDDVAAWNNKEYACSLRWTPLVPSFLGLNSFLTIPTEDSARTLNSYDNVKNHIDVCSASTGRDTNFYIADFWSVGDIPQVTQEHNLVQTSVRNRQRRRLGGGW
mmetsp:Transcript_39892/g.96295  ORF Transcript_39892/g.96295 Transcript_39892/m.96295 type:complete len:408 (+) Transcript_39892:290-1513(+)